jgi:hypothetical protein
VTGSSRDEPAGEWPGHAGVLGRGGPGVVRLVGCERIVTGGASTVTGFVSACGYGTG